MCFVNSLFNMTYSQVASLFNFTSSSLPESIYQIPVTTIDGRASSLSEFQGKTLLIVNVASGCSFTPQYEGLQKLYDTYKDNGLVVLGFPCNDFLGQEPGSNAEIATFCTKTHKINFPLFEKISVIGPAKHPLYQFLTSGKTNQDIRSEVTWNFNKFLVNKEGKVVQHFGSMTSPEDQNVIDAIVKETQ